MGMKGKGVFLCPQVNTLDQSWVSTLPQLCLPHRASSSAGGAEGGKHKQAAVAQPSTQPTSRGTVGVPGGRVQ